jgi:chromosome segregation ATPase
MEYQQRYAEQRNSFCEDLHFVHAETSYQRQMYEGQLSHAQEESSALRKQLADCVRRYEEQSCRLKAAQASLHDVSTIHTQLELKLKTAAAEKEVADDLENMLNDALRREQDRNETLEISFDVLESAYSFLARELVRTEHALEDVLKAQQQLHEHASLYDQPLSIDGQQPFRDSPQMFDDNDESSVEDDSQATASVFSDGSWPATPGLTRSIHSHTASISSLMVTTPPLPAVSLPMGTSLSKHLPPDDPDDFFGPTWSRGPLPVTSEIR